MIPYKIRESVTIGQSLNFTVLHPAHLESDGKLLATADWQDEAFETDAAKITNKIEA